MEFSDTQNKELNIAQQRVDSGTTGSPTDTNAGDLANLKYAKENGWTPTPVITSTDSKQEFDTNKAAIDQRQQDIQNRMAEANAQTTPDPNAPPATDINPRFNEDTGRVEANADPIADSLNAFEKEEKAKFEEDAKEDIKKYDDMFTTSLSAIDSSTAALIENIKSSYSNRIGEQRRINNINIARVKAYGLGNGGQYTPVSFSDAISGREQEAANQITSLENERNSLISKAQAAAVDGKNSLTRTHLEDISKIEDALREKLATVKAEADKQYDVLRAYREKAELDRKEKLEEDKQRFAAIASTFLDQYDGKDQSTKDALIKQIMVKEGLDYATVLSSLEKASSDNALLKQKAEKDALEKQKTELEIKKTQAELDQQNRGDLKQVGKNLYQITYDANGKAKTTLVQQGVATGGSGGSGGSNSITLTPTDKKKMKARGLDSSNKEDVDKYISDVYGDKTTQDEKLLSMSEFEKLAVDQVDENGNPIYNQSGTWVKDKYDEYKSAFTDQQLQKDITATDRKKMLGQGLDPENVEDVKTYIAKAYKTTKKSSVTATKQ